MLFIADLTTSGVLSSGVITEQTLWSVLILALAALIQATVGFAAALFAMPLLLWAGNDFMTAQVLVISAMLPQNVLSLWTLRKGIDLRETVVPAGVRILAMPIGILGLGVVMTWSPEQVNQLVGVIILAAILIQTFVGIEWKSAKRWYWIVITFGGSGILQGLSGMSGPPMVLWVHGQRYSADRARAFLFAMYISNFAPQVLLLWSKFGIAVWNAIAIGLLSMPLVLSSAMLGIHLGSRLGERLRPISYVFLCCLAFKSLLAPWLTG